MGEFREMIITDTVFVAHLTRQDMVDIKHALSANIGLLDETPETKPLLERLNALYAALAKYL